MTTGEALRAARTARELTQKRLAELAGISAQSLREYEYDKHVPRLSLAIYVADALNLSLNEVFMGVPAQFKKRVFNARDLADAMYLSRKRRRISLPELAEIAYCSKNTIWRAEQCLSEPQLGTIIPIAAALGMSLDEYVGRV